jgi:hypothetical protein
MEEPKIIVNDHHTLLTLQEAFNRAFPYLKMEFSQKTPVVGPRSLDLHTFLSTYRNLPGEEIIISPRMTVATLCDTIKNIYGIDIQILRKSGKSWLETILTDSWTLYEQNCQGKALSGDIV